MIRNIYILLLLSLSFGATEPQTGWFFDQSTIQAFYMFDEITIDGLVVEGDGGGIEDACYTSGTCDVIGAFRRGVCEIPEYQNSQQLCEILSVWNTDEEICVGWRYADSNGFSFGFLMGREGQEGDNTFTYMNPGESAYIKIYDSSNGSILDLIPSAELPGWDLNQIFIIDGTSTANNTFGCTDAAACNYDADAGVTSDDGSCLQNDCAGECGGPNTEDNCGVCDADDSNDCIQDCAGDWGGTAYDDCNEECSSTSQLIDGIGATGNSLDSDGNDECGVCGGDESTCTGCTNSDASNWSGESYSIDDGTCAYTVPGATNLVATPGLERVFLAWDAADDNFTQSSAGYTYDVYQDGVVVKSTSQTSSQITGLDSETEYCFTVLAIHNQYGPSADQSNQVCVTPISLGHGGPTWALQLKAEIDSYDQFQLSGYTADEWLLHDDENFLGAASDATYGYDAAHDAPDSPQGPGNYIKLFFDHPEWNEWVTHFAEDIVLDDYDFFSTNLTQWNVRVQSDVPGSTVIRFKTYVGVIPANYELYVELDGIYTRLDHSEETAIEFYMDGSGQQDLAVYIGNIVPQAPDNLTSTGNYNTIDLAWDNDGDDLNDIGNRYPATSYNVYRDDEPNDYNSNSGSPGNGPGGCGGLLTGDFGQPSTGYTDAENLYPDFPGEGLLSSSTYDYTITGSNLAGESSEGHNVRLSGGAQTFHTGRLSDVSGTTNENDAPTTILSFMESPDGANLDWENGIYGIPHNNNADENRIIISIDGSNSYDYDYPYQIDRYQWIQTVGDDDIEGIMGSDTTDIITFTVGNPHENGTKLYTWNLGIETDYPVKQSGECGLWGYELHTKSDEKEISVIIEEEPNENPIATFTVENVEIIIQNEACDINPTIIINPDQYLDEENSYDPDGDELIREYELTHINEEEVDEYEHEGMQFPDLGEGVYMFQVTLTDVYGDTGQDNLIVTVTLQDTSECPVEGCINPFACNYNPDAIEDDGSCLYYDCTGECGGSAIVDECGVCDGDGSSCGTSTSDYCLDLHSGANLISFYGLPDDVSISHVMSSIEGNATGVIGEGVAANWNGTEWQGSLNTISSLSGYWVIVSEADFLCIDDGNPTDPAIQYSLQSGANLISFPFAGSQEISFSLPDDIEGFVSGIIGEGVAANNQPPWQGSLSNLSGGNGYWMITTEDISFSFDVCVTGEFDECGICGGDGTTCFVTDIDGNVYETVQIGGQVWMAENLKVTHYRDGSEIQYVQQESSEPNVWENLSTGAYGYYNDDLTPQETYGNLYNWFAVDDERGLCMDGWHVPSDDEYKELEIFLGMSESDANSTGWRGTNEGSKLAGNADLWNSGNLENNSEFGTSGFSAFPAGYRSGGSGNSGSMGNYGYFWSSSESSSNNAWHRVLYYDNSLVFRTISSKRSGFSVRCLGD